MDAPLGVCIPPVMGKISLDIGERGGVLLRVMRAVRVFEGKQTERVKV